jgi:hypothetical protein
LHAPAGSSFAASIRAVPAAPVKTAYDDRPLTPSALLPRPVLGGGGGSPVEAAYNPGSWPDQHGNNLALQHRCTWCPVLAYKPLCIHIGRRPTR